jgi:C4-dicarboxylate transporter, DctQ subunit
MTGSSPADRCRACGWLRRRAENLSAALLAVMFVAIMVQVISRYVVNLPLGWTDEVSRAAWLWLVLWGAAFIVRDRDEIRFELLHASVGPRLRRAMTVATALALVAILVAALPATVDYVTFMKVQSTAYLHLRYDLLFSVYLLFVAAVIVRQLVLGWRAVTGRDPAPDLSRAISGL